MICSFLLPSRQSPDGLVRSIESIYSTATHPNLIEVLIRFDEDDDTTLTAWRNSHKARCAEISPNIHAVIGPRKGGYVELRERVREMAGYATGDWICMWNDDAVMLGRGWDEQLALLPLEGFIVQPGCYKLNQSEYPNCQRSAFPFFPNKSWEKFGLDFWPDACDYQADEILRVQNGWKTHYLKGITIWHDRVENRITN